MVGPERTAAGIDGSARPVTTDLAMAQPAASWQRQLRRRIATLPWVKAAGNTVFLLLFFNTYFALQHQPFFAVTQIPATPLDDWIAFQPWAMVPYLSLWVYTALPLALQPAWRPLLRYGAHMTALCLFGLTVFLLWPTSVSDAMGQRAGGGALDALYAIDDAGNACPSLHVAASVFTFLWLRAQLGAVGAPRWLHAVNAGWCLFICYATLATKQHLVLDVAAGAALGLLGGFWSLRATRRRETPMQ